jgi:hypothetical protein
MLFLAANSKKTKKKDSRREAKDKEKNYECSKCSPDDRKCGHGY